MASINTVVTDIWREKIARIYANDDSLGGFSLPSEFRIGEGGFKEEGGDKVPKDPDPSRTELEAPSLDVEDQFVFSKVLTSSDLSFISPTRVEIRCTVDSGEANEDKVGDNPEFFELGVFDDNGIMILYQTFAKEIKTSSKSLDHKLFVDF